ncbi:GTP-binding protein [Bacillus sp. PS06]|uniref:GTP-binding protein n=1 Tax=Bacillus sp. PS06 TaxID=2764176 RepID=UPI0017865CFE|nr:GTP-binding protein [Bacillus sp. PS06]MBD8068597.1 GTP-binding protein [Bacillus sp. PS06]
MTKEEVMIEKKFYERYLTGESQQHPVELLGELYFAEQQIEFCDLSYLRYAQGELYFHVKDYEAAIFKWENINNELEDWARKNMADAYFELDILPNAEEMYLSIKTDQQILSIEISLKLFSLYWVQGKINQAKDIIKQVISIDPDYQDVTSLARTFFEEQNDWDEAIELAVNEAIRTQSINWFELIKHYVEQGHTNTHRPGYFISCLSALYQLSHERFEELVYLFWQSYKNEEHMLEWIQEIDMLILSSEIEEGAVWKKLSNMYEEIYLELTNGHYLMNEVRKIVPELLVNWLRLSDSSTLPLSAASILAWNEILPVSTFSTSILDYAREVVHQQTHTKKGRSNITELYQTITIWAKAQNLSNSNQFNGLTEGLLNNTKRHLLVVGTSERGKISVRDSIIGKNMLEGPSSCAMIFSHSDDEEIIDISSQDQKVISDLSKYHYVSAANQEKSDHALLDVKVPSENLKDYQLTLIDLPCITGSSHQLNVDINYLNYIDHLFFVLNIHSPFTEKERDILNGIQKQAPNLSVTFLLTEIEVGYNDQEIQRVVKITKSKIDSFYPNAKVMAFKSENAESIRTLLEEVANPFSTNQFEKEREKKIYQSIKELLSTLTQNRSGLEKKLNETISFNNEMTSKLTGAIHQLEDTQKEKIAKITSSYSEIKHKIKNEISTNLPKRLQSCSELVEEKSNFNQIHHELNTEMNKRIDEYLKTTVEPLFLTSIHDWIQLASDEFDESMISLEELSESLNGQYGEQKITLPCDFKVLEDWKRDAERMSNRIHVQKVDILSKFSPAQFLLKGAGLILGSLQQKALVSTKYKQYIENRSYEEVINLVTAQFLEQFEFFEKAIERDIEMFFVNPFKTLKLVVEETILETDEKRQMLSEMNQRPEVFEDALTIFEVRLNQYEWLNTSTQSINI